MERLSSTGPEDFRREKNFREIFFSKMFSDFERKVSRLLAYFWSAGPSKEEFFSARGTLWRGTLFPREWDNYIKFLASDREFFAFLAKKVRRDFRIELFVSGRNFLEKTFVSQIFLLWWIFSDTGRKFFKTLCCSVQQGHWKSNLCVRRYFVTKNKMFQWTVYFYNCFRTLIGKVCTFETINCLGFKKSILCVVRSVLGEFFCINKLFFCKILPDFDWKIFDFWQSCLRQGCHHSILLLPRKVSGKIFPKKKFFSLFPDLEQKLDYWKNIKLNLKTLFYVSGGIFVGKTYFLELFDIFFLVFRAKKCNFWKEFPQNCKNMIQHVWRNVLMKLIFLTKDVFS